MPFSEDEEKGIREYFSKLKEKETPSDPEDERLDRLADKIAAKLKPSDDEKKPDEPDAKPEQKPKNGHWSERSIF